MSDFYHLSIFPSIYLPIYLSIFTYTYIAIWASQAAHQQNKSTCQAGDAGSLSQEYPLEEEMLENVVSYYKVFLLQN